MIHRFITLAVLVGCTAADPTEIGPDAGAPGIEDTSVLVTSRPNPAALPPLAGQVVNWDAYRALGVLGAPANKRYADPRSGVLVTKLTSPSVPAANANAVNDYSEGGPYISREWAPGWHTVMVRVDNAVWLADYQRGVGASRWRRIPGAVTPGSSVTASFSNHPATPRILWFVHGTRLYRYDTGAMAFAGTAGVPPGGRVIGGATGNRLEWLQLSLNDDVIVFQEQAIGRTFAYIRATNTVKYANFAYLDEPHLDRNGRYVMAVNTTNGRTFHIWDLHTNATWFVQDVYAGHVAWVRGFLVGLDPSPTIMPPFYYDPITKTRTYTGRYSDPKSLHPTHHAAQWIQTATDRTQWYYGTNDNWGGRVAATGWSLVSGSIYSSGVNWSPNYEKPTVGVRAVYQVSPTNPARMDYTLNRASSRATMTQGSWFYDATAQRIYVWARGGGIPGNRVLMFAHPSLHWGIGLRRVDGYDARFLCHNYAVNNTYWETPFGTTSPDGKLVMFHSNMGLAGGRMDVFIAEVPLTVE